MVTGRYISSAAKSMAGIKKMNADKILIRAVMVWCAQI
jgi:hypothetical protein